MDATTLYCLVGYCAFMSIVCIFVILINRDVDSW